VHFAFQSWVAVSLAVSDSWAVDGRSSRENVSFERLWAFHAAHRRCLQDTAGQSKTLAITGVSTISQESGRRESNPRSPLGKTRIITLLVPSKPLKQRQSKLHGKFQQVEVRFKDLWITDDFHLAQKLSVADFIHQSPHSAASIVAGVRERQIA